MEQTSHVNVYFLLFMGSLGMLLLSTGVIVLFVAYQKRLRKHQAHLHELQSAHQQDLLYGSIQTQELERRRVAADLHDDVGATMAAVRLSLSRIQPEGNILNENLQSIVKEGKILLDRAMVSVRNIALDMMPPELETLGLAAAIESWCSRIDTTIVIERELTITESVDPTVGLALFRMIQELLNNTIKHAEAQKITIRLTTDENQLCLFYADDGKGFSRDTKLQGGLGLKNVESRLQMIQAKTTYFSNPNEATGINITLSEWKSKT